MIKFAYPPSKLRPDGRAGKALGQCQGWVPGKPPAGGLYGFATDDIFYLEVRASLSRRLMGSYLTWVGSSLVGLSV